jgi:hypothetical protein
MVPAARKFLRKINPLDKHSGPLERRRPALVGLCPQKTRLESFYKHEIGFFPTGRPK